MVMIKVVEMVNGMVKMILDINGILYLSGGLFGVLLGLVMGSWIVKILMVNGY